LTMYESKNLNEEVERIHGELSTNAVVPKSWLAQAVVLRHQNVSGGDADFAIWAMGQAINRAIEAFFRRIKASEEAADDPQMILPGYERLQRRYLVTRGGEVASVPVQLVTDEEFRLKISEMNNMQEGLEKHKLEILRFMRERASTVSLLAAKA